MTPTLNPGDLVLVDTQDKNADDGLFVVSLDNGPCIRRLQRLPGRQVRIICDNPHYERLTVNSASGALRVLGRVAHCWAGRK